VLTGAGRVAKPASLFAVHAVCNAKQPGHAHLPGRNERVRERSVDEVNRDGVVQHPTHPRGRNDPTIVAAVLGPPGEKAHAVFLLAGEVADVLLLRPE
jgi:hypothetical protein